MHEEDRCFHIRGLLLDVTCRCVGHRSQVRDEFLREVKAARETLYPGEEQVRIGASERPEVVDCVAGIGTRCGRCCPSFLLVMVAGFRFRRHSGWGACPRVPAPRWQAFFGLAITSAWRHKAAGSMDWEEAVRPDMALASDASPL